MTDTEILLPTSHGDLTVRPFVSEDKEYIVAFKLPISEIPFVRLHSSCVFSESFGAQDCDCADQLGASLDIIAEHGGILIYAYEEGRGVGLVNKFRSIHLEQKEGLNTAESFKALGYPKEPRDFKGHIQALRSVFTGGDIKILSKNPAKLTAVKNAGINIVEDVQLKFSMSELKKEYVLNKNKHLGHTNEIG